MEQYTIPESFIGQPQSFPKGEKLEFSIDKNLQKTIYESVKRALLEVQNKNTNEKLTVKKITEEYGINKDKVYQMFQDPKLPVQTYVKPQFVLKSEFEKYLSSRHDYLSNR